MRVLILARLVVVVVVVGARPCICGMGCVDGIPSLFLLC